MNQYQSHKYKKGFTLIELMIVISVIVILTSIGFFPFSYYLERARVEKNIDSLSQEWLILHEDIRNWLLYDPLDPASPHAHLFVTLKTNTDYIDLEVATGSSATRKFYKRIVLEKPIEIHSFSGSADSATKVVYHLTPPFATGAYAIDSSAEAVISSWIILEIWYPKATLNSGRSRQILLRPRHN